MEKEFEMLNERLTCLEKRISELEAMQQTPIQVFSTRGKVDPLIEQFYRAQREMTS